MLSFQENLAVNRKGPLCGARKWGDGGRAVEGGNEKVAGVGKWVTLNK